MKFTQTKIEGVYIVEIEPKEDERGFFARTWCIDAFKEHNIDHELSQCSVSSNKKKGTLRGMHYQAEPHAESKLVRATKGSVYDVALDLRPSSKTFKQWISVELSAKNHKALFIPKGCAHGFQSLTDETEVLYMISNPYVPGFGRGVRWNDPAFGIRWPIAEPILADRDRDFPDFE